MEAAISTDAGNVWSAWLLGSMQFWRVAPLGRCTTVQRAGLALSGEPHLAMNWGLIDAGEHSEQDLKQCVAALRALSLPAYLLFTSAAAPTLEAAALELGLEQAECSPLMIRDTSPATPSEARIRVSHVHDEHYLHLLAETAADAFEVPAAAVTRAFDPLWLRSPDVDLFLAWDVTSPSAAASRLGLAAGRGSGR